MDKAKKGDVRVIKNDKVGETDIFYSASTEDMEKEKKKKIDAGLDTAAELFKHRVKLSPKKVLFREKVGDKYIDFTFEEVKITVEALARALIEGGFCPDCVVDGEKMRFLGCYLHNRREAAITDLASFYMGAISISLFEEPRDQMEYLANECCFETIITQPNYAKTLISQIETKQVRFIKNFILTEDLDSESLAKGKSLGIIFYSYKEMIEKGTLSTCSFPTVKPSDVCGLIITSGSTGFPKASVIHHNVPVNLLCGYFGKVIDSDSSVCVNINYGFGSIKIAVMTCLFQGGTVIFYGSQIEKTFDAMRDTNPSFMIFPPIFMHKAYPGIVASLNLLPSPHKEQLLSAIQEKIAYMKEKKELTHPVLDKYIAPLKQKLFGNNLKVCYYVGASMRDDILWFYRAILGIPFVSIYGLTESGGWCTLGSPFARGDTLGAPVAGYEIKLVDCIDKGYTVKDVINGKLTPRGEIIIRGDSAFTAYFKSPEKSKAQVLGDGWVRTLDIAQLDLDDYTMVIVDRANNIKKLSNEEFIASELLEKLFEETTFVAQMYIHVSPSKDFLVAIAYPNMVASLSWAKKKGLKEDFEEICRNLEFKKEILTELHDKATKKGLNSYEHIQDILLTPNPFTQANGFLTFTYKLRRQNIEKVFGKEIEEMYKDH